MHPGQDTAHLYNTCFRRNQIKENVSKRKCIFSKWLLCNTHMSTEQHRTGGYKMDEKKEEIKTNLRSGLYDLLKIIIHLSSEKREVYGLSLPVRLRIHHQSIDIWTRQLVARPPQHTSQTQIILWIPQVLTSLPNILHSRGSADFIKK